MFNNTRIRALPAPDSRHLLVLLLCAAVLVLPGCMVQSDVQARYNDKQDDCRDDAESRMDAAPQDGTVSSKQRNAMLVDYFSTCMIKGGWHVARPVKNPVVPTPPGTAKNPQEAALPAQPLPGQPSDRITAASPREPQPGAKASSPPNQAVKTNSSVLQPAPGQPALSEPATVGGPQAAPASTYQRTPAAPAAPAGGTGVPGRNF